MVLIHSWTIDSFQTGSGQAGSSQKCRGTCGNMRSISETSSCFFGPRPWHIEIRHRVKQNIHNQFVRIWDSQIENSKIEIMETDRNSSNIQYDNICYANIL